MDIVIIIFLLFGVSIFFVVVLSITTVQQKKSRLLLTKLESEEFEYAQVKFIQNQTSKFTATGGLTIKAEMYFNDSFIMFCPKNKGLFNGMHNFNLPVIFTKDVEKYKNITQTYNVIHPDEIKITSLNNLKIKYKVISAVNRNYSIQVNFINKSDLTRLKNAKNKLLY